MTVTPKTRKECPSESEPWGKEGDEPLLRYLTELAESLQLRQVGELLANAQTKALMPTRRSESTPYRGLRARLRIDSEMARRVAASADAATTRVLGSEAMR